MAVYEKSSLPLQGRVYVCATIVLLCFLTLAIRLWYLQIIKGDYFRERSENNRQKTVFVPAPRGSILDRHGTVLAMSRPAFQVEVTTEETEDLKGTIALLAQVTGRSEEELSRNFEKSSRLRRRYESSVVLKDIPRDELAKVVAVRPYLPGVSMTAIPARDYPYDDLAAHVIGYLREISQEQLESPRFSFGYRLGDLVGQYGVESKWEQYLQGKRGSHLVIVNARGNRVRELPNPDEAIPGHNVVLTLDLASQQAADLALKEQRGAIVAMNPNTGEILALSSSPRFNPEMFVGEVPAEVWQELIAGRDRPLNNRAVQGLYPPGSIFKAIMAAAILSEGVANARDSVNCPGFYSFGGRRYHCHKRQGHGSVNLKKALIVSCDVYFYVMGQRLGVDRIHEYSSRFGLGSPTGLDLVREPTGLVPSTQWKREYFKGTEEARWYPGETLSVAIGQGATQVTPLQMAVSFSAVVNGGKVLRPRIVKEVFSTQGHFRDQDFETEVLSTVDVSEQILDQVREGLVGVVQDPEGTAKRAALPKEYDVDVAGKTGTAQVVSLDKLGDDQYLNHHAWFVGYAPSHQPEIVVSALIENGGHGGVAAAPVVRSVLEAYFKDRLTRDDNVKEGNEELGNP